MTLTLVRESSIPVPPDELFAWHSREGAFERLGPPWQDIRVVGRTGSIRNGDRISIRLKHGPFWVAWDAVHRDFEPGRRFCDTATRGPFPFWEHSHEMLADPSSPNRSLLRDVVRWRPPFGLIGRLFRRKLEADLDKLFRFRHARTAADLGFHARYLGQRRRCVMVAGWDSRLGRQVCGMASTGGHRVLRLVGEGYQPVGEGSFGGGFVSLRVAPALEPAGTAVRLSGGKLLDASTGTQISSVDGLIVVPRRDVQSTGISAARQEVPLSSDGLPTHPDPAKGVGHLLRHLAEVDGAPRVRVVLAGEQMVLEPEVVSRITRVPVGDLRRRPRPRDAADGWTEADRSIADALAAVLEA